MSNYADKHRSTASCASSVQSGASCMKTGKWIANTEAGLRWLCEDHYRELTAQTD